MHNLAHVRGRVLVELLIGAKDDDRDIDRAEHRQLMSLFEEAAFALEKGAVARGMLAR